MDSHKKLDTIALMTRILDTYDPTYYLDVQGKPKWEKAMEHEMDSLENNHTWCLVPWLTRKNVVKFRWVYQTKFTFSGVVEHPRACFLMKGFSYQEGTEYIETFSPITEMNSIWLILSLIAHFEWEINQMDVKHAFLHGDLCEEIYMENPSSFMIDSTLVCQLKKSLYGLKRVP